MRFLLYVCIIISLTACSHSSSNTFKLEGFIEGGGNSENNVLLIYDILKNNEWYNICDTAKIIDGKFLFEGTIDELTAATLWIDGNYPVRIYIEPAAMELKISECQPYMYNLSGTTIEKENIELRKELMSEQRTYYENIKYLADINDQIETYNDNITTKDSLSIILLQCVSDLKNCRMRMNDIYLDFCLRYNGSYQIVPDLIYMLATSDSIPVDTIKHLYNNMSERMKISSMGKFALKQIECRDSEKNTSIGYPAPDFTRKEISGKTITLSEFRDKNFVLLDFWASWCAPCIKEIPKIKDLYNKYGVKGLAIISISLDKNSKSWRDAVNKYQLEEWPQILAIEDKNNSFFDDIAAIYKVKAIPHFILIDKKGTIIANGAGGKQLIEINRILEDKLGDL